LNVEANNSILVIIDDTTRNIGYAFFKQAKLIGCKTFIIEMEQGNINGEEPHKVVAEAMKNVDIVIAPTSKSLSHTNARRDASDMGVRIATMPGITEDIMLRTLSGDFIEIHNRTIELATKLKNVKEIRVITPLGTDLLMNFEGREFSASSGILSGNKFGNLPGAEVCTGPVEGTTNGIVYVDGAMIGMIDKPIKLTVTDGYVTSIEGGDQAKELDDILSSIGKDAYNIAELGIGTNHMAILSGNVLEDEKVLGTVHVAVGNNISFGGTINVPIHLDGIIKNPTLIADGITIMENGKLK